jgi:hypothetical protein
MALEAHDRVSGSRLQPRYLQELTKPDAAKGAHA